MPRGGALPLGREANAAHASVQVCPPPRSTPLAAAAMRATCTPSGRQDRVTIGPEAMLIERALELDVLGNAVTRLAGGEGGIVVLAAPAGLGKTALLEHAAQEATAAGCRVRRAAPGPLERHFGFGVVRALLEGPLRDASDERARAAARRGGRPGRRPAARRRRARAPTPPWPSPTACCGCARPWPTTRRSCSWSTTRTGPTAPSLEVLAYLARRIGELPLLIAVGARADDPDAAVGPAQPDRRRPRGDGAAPPAAEPSRRGAAHPPRGAVTRRSRSAATAIARRPATRGCWASSAARSPTTARAQSTPPKASPRRMSAIARTVVRGRLAELSARDRAVVEALAVIGEGAPRQVVAAVAGRRARRARRRPRRAAGRRAAAPRAARASRTT